MQVEGMETRIPVIYRQLNVGHVRIGEGIGLRAIDGTEE